MPKGWMVTPQMRTEWFDYNGWYADDAVILKWYKKRYSSKAKEKKNEKR